MDLVKQKVKSIVCLTTDSTKLEAAFSPLGLPIRQVFSAEEAVEVAKSWAVEGDVVLLSPACASFDLFQNYVDRGRRFKEGVLRLIDGQQV